MPIKRDLLQIFYAPIDINVSKKFDTQHNSENQFFRKLQKSYKLKEFIKTPKNWALFIHRSTLIMDPDLNQNGPEIENNRVNIFNEFILHKLVIHSEKNCELFCLSQPGEKRRFDGGWVTSFHFC